VLTPKLSEVCFAYSQSEFNVIGHGVDYAQNR
jgi:hypothetical protein